MRREGFPDRSRAPPARACSSTCSSIRASSASMNGSLRSASGAARCAARGSRPAPRGCAADPRRRLVARLPLERRAPPLEHLIVLTLDSRLCRSCCARPAGAGTSTRDVRDCRPASRSRGPSAPPCVCRSMMERQRVRERGVPAAVFLVEPCRQALDPVVPVRARRRQRARGDGALKSRVGGQRQQVAQLEAGAEHPESGIDERPAVRRRQAQSSSGPRTCRTGGRLNAART